MLLRTLTNAGVACAIGLCAIGAQNPSAEGGTSQLPRATGDHQPPLAPSRPLAGDIGAGIPYAALGPNDGLPATLARGRAYTVNVPVWVASNGTAGVASVQIGDATCRHNVRPGTTLHLACAFTVRKAGPISVSAVVCLADGVAASQTYHHTA